MGYWDKWKHDDQADPYVKFTEPGQTIEGVIIRLSSTDFGGKSSLVPVITLRTPGGIEKIINCSQTVLQRRMAELAPEEGDGVKITYLGEAERSMPGRSPAKLFDVEVTPAAWLRRETESPAPASPRAQSPRPAASGVDEDPF